MTNNRVHWKNRLIGLALVFILSCIMLAFFYGKIIFSLNTIFFSTGGDGILCYYNSHYLATYDTALMYSHSINYPYGEIAFYAQSQPLIVGMVKFISTHFADITSYTVGILIS
jgi:hypothetical protein